MQKLSLKELEAIPNDTNMLLLTITDAKVGELMCGRPCLKTPIQFEARFNVVTYKMKGGLAGVGAMAIDLPKNRYGDGWYVEVV